MTRRWHGAEMRVPVCSNSNAVNSHTPFTLPNVVRVCGRGVGNLVRQTMIRTNLSNDDRIMSQ